MRWSACHPLQPPNHKLLTQPSHMVSSASGPTCPGQFQTLKTCSNHWRMSSGTSSYQPSQARMPSATMTDIDLMALPARLGGLGIIDPSHQTTTHYKSSEKITAPLASLILLQSQHYPPEAKEEQTRAKTTARNQRRQQEAKAAEELKRECLTENGEP